MRAATRWLVLMMCYAPLAVHGDDSPVFLWQYTAPKLTSPRPDAEVQARAASENSPIKRWQYEAVHHALLDPDFEVAGYALIWLQRNARPDTPQNIPPALRSGVHRWLADVGTPEGRRQVLALVTSLGPGLSEAAPAIAKLLSHDDRFVRAEAAQALEQLDIAGEQYVEGLVALLDDDIPLVHEAAISALGKMGRAGIRVGPALVGLLDDENSDRPRFAAAVLGRMGPAGAQFAPAVVPLLDDKSWLVRWQAARTLKEMGAVSAQLAPTVARVLSDTNGRGAPAQISEVTWQAGRVIGEVIARRGASENRAFAAILARWSESEADSMLAVTALLGNSNRLIRFEAVNVLAQQEHVSAKFAPAIVRRLQDDYPETRLHALWAIRNMQGAGAQSAPAVAALLRDEDLRIRLASALTLAKMGAAGAQFAPAVAALLNDTDFNVRRDAAAALGEMGSSGAKFAPALANALKDELAEVRSAAAAALGKAGQEAAPFAPALAALLRDEDSRVRTDAATALGKLGAPSAAFAPALATLLADQDSATRAAAVAALGQLGVAGAHVAQYLAELLVWKSDSSLRLLAADALDTLSARSGPIDTASVLAPCLESSLVHRDQSSRIRFTCYLLGARSAEGRLLLEWVGGPKAQRDDSELTDDDAFEALPALDALWHTLDHARADGLPSTPRLRSEVADVVRRIAMAHDAGFTLAQVPLLQSLIEKMESAGLSGSAATLREVRAHMQAYAWLRKAIAVLGLHVAMWVLLIWVYPHSRFLQAAFFWNRWVRRFLGLGYVGLAITFIPFLRRRMFVPFRDSLLQRGAVLGYEETSFFGDRDVIEGAAQSLTSRQSIAQALQAVSGQVVLEGESGLGKTTMLRHLALASPRIVVLLRATESDEGVMEAIQARLQGYVRDRAYLHSLIYAGAMDVLIDGLNEATPDTRARIVQFAEGLFCGNFILTTQPMDWAPPQTARVLVLMPLRPDQIRQFLTQQWSRIAAGALMDEPRYAEVVADYVAAILAGGEADPRLKVLSNPMEATLVAELLSRNEHPDLPRLVEQRYVTMERDFTRSEGRSFPYRSFAERVYAWRVSGKPYFDPTGFDAEVEKLVEHKLMTRRDVAVRESDGTRHETRWRFRHDKFMEFALLPAFVEEHADRRLQHLTDEAFSGVYELLATKLSDADDAALFDHLVQHAADTRRNDLLNRYTLARRGRAVARERAREPATAPAIA